MSTLVSRLIYWQDGLFLWIKNPLGIGAGAWNLKQYQVQTMGYSVKYVHNSFLQIALDGGLISLAIIIVLFILGLTGLYKKWHTSKDPLYLALFGIVTLMGLHGFVDIDFSYTAVLLILGFVLSYGITSKDIKIKRYLTKSLCTLIVAISLFTGIHNLLQSNIKEGYSTLLEQHNKTPQNTVIISRLYHMAYTKSDYENMYIFSKTWILLAPRQQIAYDSYLVALDRMIEKTNEDTYRQEKTDLYKQAQYINETANSLTGYFDSYKNITLPKSTKAVQ